VKFALEVHPTEIAFDIVSAERTWRRSAAVPSSASITIRRIWAIKGVDYVAFIRKFADRIYHVHMKDVYWSSQPTEAGVFGGHTKFGDARRFWEFRSLGRGCVKFEEIIRRAQPGELSGAALGRMGRHRHGPRARRGRIRAFVRKLDFAPSAVAFDAAFEKK